MNDDDGVCLFVCVFVNECRDMLVCMCVCVVLYVYVCVGMYFRVHVRIYVHTCMCAYTNEHVNKYVFTASKKQEKKNTIKKKNI